MMSRLTNWEFTRGRMRERTGNQHGETIKLGSQYSIMVRKLDWFNDFDNCQMNYDNCHLSTIVLNSGNRDKLLFVRVGGQRIIIEEANDNDIILGHLSF